MKSQTASLAPFSPRDTFRSLFRGHKQFSFFYFFFLSFSFHSFSFRVIWRNDWGVCTINRYKLPEKAMPKEVAYEVIHDELLLDGNPRLNLASFVTTWMEPECDKLMLESINKNYVDMEEYPATTELQVLYPSFLSYLRNFFKLCFCTISDQSKRCTGCAFALPSTWINFLFYWIDSFLSFQKKN